MKKLVEGLPQLKVFLVYFTLMVLHTNVQFFSTDFWCIDYIKLPGAVGIPIVWPCHVISLILTEIGWVLGNVNFRYFIILLCT